jgi:L-glyceraldehyde 3-phosphate reductase
MLQTAFDGGITHFDLANNYGPLAGAAEENFGRILARDFHGYRDELVISTKAGFGMWPGPYGDWGSKKYLVASLDQSLQRMGVDYVDIFYHHRPDPHTPLDETLDALDLIVRQGKALYVGISNYPAELAQQASVKLRQLGRPLLIHQASYSMFDRWIEPQLLAVAAEEQFGIIAFCPLAQGLLTHRYLDGMPADSRAVRPSGSLTVADVTPHRLQQIRALHAVAQDRQQTLAQMALAWVLRDRRVTSALIGASRPSQVEENLQALKQLAFTADELASIEAILGDADGSRR